MTDDLVLSVSRADDGRWFVRGDDGSELEGPFSSRGAAARWIEDRADLDDRDLRSMVSRASPAQRRRLRGLLDEIDGAGDAAR
jgi:hypothetical protein